MKLAECVHLSTVWVLRRIRRAVASRGHPVGQFTRLDGMQSTQLHRYVLLERNGHYAVNWVVWVATLYDHDDVWRRRRGGCRRRHNRLARWGRQTRCRHHKKLDVGQRSEAVVVLNNAHVVQPGVGNGDREGAEHVKLSAVEAVQTRGTAAGVVQGQIDHISRFQCSPTNADGSLDIFFNDQWSADPSRVAVCTGNNVRRRTGRR